MRSIVCASWRSGRKLLETVRSGCLFFFRKPWNAHSLEVFTVSTDLTRSVSLRKCPRYDCAREKVNLRAHAKSCLVGPCRQEFTSYLFLLSESEN